MRSLGEDAYTAVMEEVNIATHLSSWLFTDSTDSVRFVTYDGQISIVCCFKVERI